MFLVDSDVLSHLQRGHPRVVAHFSAVPRSELATSIITYIEIVRARHESLLKAAERASLSRRNIGWMKANAC